MHFHLSPIDLSQAWQSFKIKRFTVCKNNPKHMRKNCFVHTWTHQKHLKNPKTTGQTLYFKLSKWSLIPEASNPCNPSKPTNESKAGRHVLDFKCEEIKLCSLLTIDTPFFGCCYHSLGTGCNI